MCSNKSENNKNNDFELPYYAYFHCDAWKSKESMKFVGVFDEYQLSKIIIEDIVDDAVRLENQEKVSELSVEEINTLLLAVEKEDKTTLNNKLVYGYVSEAVLNERC